MTATSDGLKERYLILYEVMFCDYEQNSEVLKSFRDVWLANLKRMASFPLPIGSNIKIIVYLSEDKVEDRKLFLETLAKLPEEQAQRFVHVEYTHPKEGYGYTSDSHPDLWKNPNKVAPRRDALFEKALKSISLADYDRFIRASIDDDDYLLSWQFYQLIEAAELAYEPGKVVGVGLRNEVVAYAGKKTADVVQFSHHMHGNKFYVGDGGAFQALSKLSPWSIPEVFDENNRTRLAKAGATLKVVEGGAPGYVYCRWGHNLSLHDKTNYYLHKYESIQFDSIEGLVERIELAYSQPNYASDAGIKPLSIPPVQGTQKKSPNPFVVSIQENDADPEDTFALILKSGDGKMLVNRRLDPKSKFPIGNLTDLPEDPHEIFGFVQLRKASGEREELPGRGRIDNVSFIKTLTLAQWATNVEKVHTNVLERLKTALAASSWIWDSDLDEYFESLRHQARTNESYGPNKSDIRLLDYVLASNIPSSLRIVNHLAQIRDYLDSQESSASLAEFDATQLPEATPGRNDFRYGPAELSYFYRPNHGKPLVIVFHGRKAAEVTLPYLPGSGLTSGLDVAFMSISDPSLALDSELTIGWHAGSIHFRNLQKDLVALISHVAAQNSSPQVILVGGSAGGFASLVLSRMIPGSTAIAWNAQTEIRRYYKRFVDFYAQIAWDNRLPSSNTPSTTVSVLQLYAATPATNRVVFLQEQSDTHHVNEHFRPFREQQSSEPDLWAYENHWGEGHAPAPKPLIRDFILAICSDNVDAELEQLGAERF